MIKMVIEDRLLSEYEINYLDAILSDISKDKKLRDLSKYEKPWEYLSNKGPIEALESLRIKGIFNIEKRNKASILIEQGEERIQDQEVEVGILQPIELIKSWLATIYYRSGKSLDSESLIELVDSKMYFSFPMKMGSDSINIKFVTKDADETELMQGQRESIFVSFIGNLPIKEQYYIHWFDPLSELSAAARFFIWINEQSKPLMSKYYSYLNIPSDLEKQNREEVLELLKKYLEQLEFERQNQPEYFKPESSDYFFPEGSIRECFIKKNENKKIFVTQTGDRVDIHTFEKGIKGPDVEISYHLNKLQEWIDRKSKTYRKLTNKIKSNLLAELLKLTPIFIAIIISCFTSYKLLYAQNQLIKNFPQSSMWFKIHIILGFVAIFSLFIIGVLPQLRFWLFTWDRRLKRFVKNNKKNINNIDMN